MYNVRDGNFPFDDPHLFFILCTSNPVNKILAGIDESLPEWIDLRVDGLPENNKLKTFNTFLGNKKAGKKLRFNGVFFWLTLCFLYLASFICQQSTLI